MGNANSKKSGKESISVEEQWYQKNPELQELEIQAMKRHFPDATYGYLPDGRMYWQVDVDTISKEKWTLLAVYNSDHPSLCYGSSVNVYPVKPNYDELMQLVDKANVYPKRISRTLRDDEYNISFFSLINADVLRYAREGKVSSAVVYIRDAMQWIAYFQTGLSNQDVWEKFTGQTGKF